MSKGLQQKVGKMIVEGFVQKSELRKFKVCFIASGQFGGRLADELVRLEHEAIVINTAESDMKDLKVIPEKDRFILKGLGGSAKNLALGQQTLLSNTDVLFQVLNDKRVIEADYVFVTAGLGGATGNSSLPYILGTLGQLREHKKIMGRHTHGAIVSMPGEWEPRGMKENAFYGIDAITKLHKSNSCGAVIVLDNTKLKDSSESIFVDNVTSNDWRDSGNCATASMLTEVISLLDLPSSKSFDKAEFLDVLSTPGFLTFGKKSITTPIESDFKGLIHEALVKSPTADGYNHELYTTNGFLSVVKAKSRNGKPELLSDLKFTDLEKEFFEFIPAAPRPHSGYATIDAWPIIKSRGELQTHDQAIIYVGLVSQELPNSIKRMLIEVEKSKRELQEKQEAAREAENELDLSKYSQLATISNEQEKNVTSNPFDLLSLPKDSDKKNDKNGTEHFNLDLSMYNK